MKLLKPKTAIIAAFLSFGTALTGHSAVLETIESLANENLFQGGAGDLGQSFLVNQTGCIESVAFEAHDDHVAGTVSIYAGGDETRTQIYSQPGPIWSQSGLVDFILDAPVPVTAGQTYSVNSGIEFLRGSTSDPYPDGDLVVKSGFPSPPWDAAFRIVIVDCAAAFYTVGGSVSGLTSSVTLKNNGVDELVVNADGGFTFSTELADGSAYAVTVSSQPTGQTCTVSNGSGTIDGADITDVSVTCVDNVVPTYSLGGTVSGLTGSGMALQNNGADTLAVAADGPFTFVTELTDLSDYLVTVSTQPTGQTCSVTNGSGTIDGADITDVSVTCVDNVVPTYSVGGTVSGLTGSGMALQNNGADTLAVAADGPFTFVTELTDLSDYLVTVSTQPTGQTCSVTNGSGTIDGADITDVGVTCEDDVEPPVAPPAPATPVPTLANWALMTLAVLLGMLVIANRRRLFQK